MDDTDNVTLERDEFDELEELEATRNRNIIATVSLAAIALGLLLLQRRRQSAASSAQDVVETVQDTASKLADLEGKKLRLGFGGRPKEAAQVAKKQQEVYDQGKVDVQDQMGDLASAIAAALQERFGESKKTASRGFKLFGRRKKGLGDKASDLMDTTKDRIADMSDVAAGVLSDALSKAGENYDDLKPQMSKAIQKSVSKVMKQYTRRRHKSALAKLADTASEYSEKGQKAAKKAIESASDTAGEYLPKAQVAALGLVGTASDVADQYRPKVQKTAMDLVGTAQDKYEEYRPVVKSAASKASDRASDILDQYGPEAQAALEKALDALQDVAKEYRPKAEKAAKEARETLGDLGEQLASRIFDLAETFTEDVVPSLKESSKKARPVVGAAPVVAVAAASKLAENLGGTASDMFDKANDAIGGTKGRVSDAASAVANAPKAAGKAIGDATDVAVDATTSTATNLIWIAALAFIAFIIYVPDPKRRAEITRSVKDAVSSGQRWIKEMQGYANPDNLPVNQA